MRRHQTFQRQGDNARLVKNPLFSISRTSTLTPLLLRVPGTFKSKRPLDLESWSWMMTEAESKTRLSAHAFRLGILELDDDGRRVEDTAVCPARLSDSAMARHTAHSSNSSSSTTTNNKTALNRSTDAPRLMVRSWVGDL